MKALKKNSISFEGNYLEDYSFNSTAEQNPDKISNAVQLEEERLMNISKLDEYDMIHERHRIFPEIFENRNHKKILDLSAGVGVVGNRINKYYDAELLCNDISPKCLQILKSLKLNVTSFNIDNESRPFELEEAEFDAIISLSTIEHLYNIDHFLKEVNRCLTPGGYFYLSAPNYNGIGYLLPLLLTGKTFHNPLTAKDRYEFFGHLRYFTYRSLLEYVTQFGFEAEAVYIGKPQEGTKYLKLKAKSKSKAFMVRQLMTALYHLFSPRWATEPVICFRKTNKNDSAINPRKVIL